MRQRLFQSVLVVVLVGVPGCRERSPGLWPLYQQTLKRAKYIDLTHTITPAIPVWHGFGPATFGPTLNPATDRPYSYEQDGFAATAYRLSTDQYGTQLDPPAHWAPEFPAIDELPPTYAVRPLVVLSITDSVARHAGYHLQVADIEAWERRNGRIPEGAVVMVRSAWRSTRSSSSTCSGTSCCTGTSRSTPTRPRRSRERRG